MAPLAPPVPPPLPLAQVYAEHEKAKKDAYEERVRESEKGSFIPLIFTTSGGMGQMQGWRNEFKPGGATFEFLFTMLFRRRFAPPRSHSFTGAFQACNIMTSLQLV